MLNSVSCTAIHKHFVHVLKAYRPICLPCAGGNGQPGENTDCSGKDKITALLIFLRKTLNLLYVSSEWNRMDYVELTGS